MKCSGPATCTHCGYSTSEASPFDIPVVSNTCQPTVLNCSTYSGSYCSACVNGFRLLNNECTPCDSLDNFGAGCTECSSDKCDTCEATNFYMLPNEDGCGRKSANCAAPDS